MTFRMGAQFLRKQVYNTPMRIGFFSDMYLPHVSGITNHMRLYKRFLEDRGHEVFLITFGSTRYDDDEPNVIRNPGVPVGNTGYSYSPGFVKKVRDLIPTLDIVHTHHPFQSGSYLMHHMKKIDVPLVFTNHTRYDLYADVFGKYVPYTYRHKTISSFLTTFTQRCDLVVAPSAGIVDWLSEYAHCNDAQIIPNGIDLAVFADKKPCSKTRASLGVRDEDLLFCYVGRVSHEKNISYMLSEFAAIAKNHPRAKLVIVGDGMEMEYAHDFAVRNNLVNQITFTGGKNFDEIPRFVTSSDAFITGSVSEVHPLVVIEALAAGLPVIAVESPGISCTVEHGKSGLLAKYPERNALAEQAEKIVADEGLRLSLVDGAIRRASNYCLANTAGQLLNAYEELLA